jgi:hypothetical protein
VTDITVSDTLRVAADALEKAIESVPDRSYLDVQNIVQRVVAAYRAEADVLEAGELLERHREAVEESRSFGGVANENGDVLMEGAASPPDEVANEAVGYGRPTTTRELELELERRRLSYEISNLRIEVPPGDTPLEVAIGIRDEIALRVKSGM